MRTLRDRIVVVTGAAGGVGRALSRRFAAAGARLVLVDCDAAGLRESARALGGAVLAAHAVDVAEDGAAGALRDAVLAGPGTAHVLVNNAGLTVHGAFADLTAADIDRVLDVDLRAPLRLTRAFLPLLRAGDEGHVVFVASMAGLQPFPFQSVYSAAKAGLLGFARALAIELGGTAVGVTTVVPGAVATSFLSRAASRDPALSASLGRLVQRHGTPPERVAAATVRAVRRGTATVHVGWDSHLVRALTAVAPAALPALLTAGVRARRRRSGETSERGRGLAN